MAPPQGDSSGGRRPPRKAPPRPGGKPGAKPGGKSGRPPSGKGGRSGQPRRSGGESGGDARGRGGKSGSRPPRADARGGSGAGRGGRPGPGGGDRRPRRASEGGSDRPRRPARAGGDRGRRESAGGFAYGAEARKDARPGREEPRGPKSWGGLARRGAGRITSDVGPLEPKQSEPGEAWEPEQWIDEGELRDEAAGAVGRSRAPGRKPAAERSPRRDDRDGDDGEDAARHVPPERRARFEARLKDASEAFRRERYDDARRLLRPLAEQAPGAASVRELYGLTLYRLGRWAQAQRELEAFHTLTGSAEQNPVLADSLRALGRYDEVDELWEELRAASPSAELVAEGRIVTAGAWADQGRLDDAIGLLESAAKPTKRPKLHHLRIAYALADLYERSGDLPRARELFRLVADNDPDFVDVAARLRALR